MTGPEMLKKWLRGFGYTEGLREYIETFPEAQYRGQIYRGIYFDHYPAIKEIQNSDFCSWTSSLDVAYYFATHTKYGFILSKQSTGYDVEKLLKLMAERNELPDDLKKYRVKASEKEVIDTLNMNLVTVQRVGIF